MKQSLRSDKLKLVVQGRGKKYCSPFEVTKTMPTSIGLKQKIQHGHINQEVFNKYEKLGEEIT